MSRSDTDNTELDVHQSDVHQSEVVHPSSNVCDSPLSRQPQQSAQLDSDKDNLKAKVGPEVFALLGYGNRLQSAYSVGVLL